MKRSVSVSLWVKGNLTIFILSYKQRESSQIQLNNQPTKQYTTKIKKINKNAFYCSEAFGMNLSLASLGILGKRFFFIVFLKPAKQS